MKTDYIELKNDVTISAKSWKYSGTDVTVNAVHDTEYYLVNTETGVITYFTDYTNVPEIAAKYISAMYAVAENTAANSSGNDYWVADVVVIELTDWDKGYDSVSLAYWNDARTTNTVKTINVLDNVADGNIATVVPATMRDWDDQWTRYGFYTLTSTTTEDDTIAAQSITPITKDYNSYGIYAGVVDYTNKVESRGGYIVLTNGKKIDTDGVAVYSVTNRRDVNTVNTLSVKDLAAGDELIYVMNKAKTAVSFIVKVSTLTGDAAADFLTSAPIDLYNAIIKDQASEDEWTVTVNGHATVTGLGDTIKKSVTSVEITAITPDTGYSLATQDVLVSDDDNAKVQDLGNGEYLVYDICGDVSLTVATTEKTYVLTVNTDANVNVDVKIGSAEAVNVAAGQSDKTFNVQEGASVIFTTHYDSTYGVADTSTNTGNITAMSAAVTASFKSAKTNTALLKSLSIKGKTVALTTGAPTSNSLTITATEGADAEKNVYAAVAADGATITRVMVDGTVTDSDSKAVFAADSSHTIVVVVASADGTVTKSYTINLTVSAKSNVKTLQSVSNATYGASLSGTTIKIPTSVSEGSMTKAQLEELLTTTDANATIEIDTDYIVTGTKVTVRAENGIDTQDYTVSFTDA
jgi:hypothetical protein